MFPVNTDLGASLYKTWSEEQRRDEIVKLVEGYRSGVPVGILCKMVETIAGDRKKARNYLLTLMSLEERRNAVENESGGMQVLARSYLL